MIPPPKKIFRALVETATAAEPKFRQQNPMWKVEAFAPSKEQTFAPLS